MKEYILMTKDFFLILCLLVWFVYKVESQHPFKIILS